MKIEYNHGRLTVKSEEKEISNGRTEIDRLTNILIKKTENDEIQWVENGSYDFSAYSTKFSTLINNRIVKIHYFAFSSKNPSCLIPKCFLFIGDSKSIRIPIKIIKIIKHNIKARIEKEREREQRASQEKLTENIKELLDCVENKEAKDEN